MISIVTPVYNEEDNVIFFHDAVTRVMKETGMAYELIYVDDGSHDRTNELICGLAEKDPHVRALTFARNFGHQIAITCGMDFARGDAVITMDGDMQHPPALIPTLIGKWKEGYDIVQTVRTATEDAGPIKKITSAGYYTIINSISKTPVLPGGSDFRLMDRKALDVFLKFREHSRFIRGIVGGLGFKTASVKFEAPARHAGVSKFNMRKMLHFAVDGILTNSTTPPSCRFLRRHLCRYRRHHPDTSCSLRLPHRRRRSRLDNPHHPRFFLWRRQPCRPRHHRRIYRTHL